MATRDENRVTFFAHTNFCNQHKAFGIRQADRRSHIYIIGKTGTGKSTLLATMVRQNMEAGQGLALLDPHGDLVEKLLPSVPESRKRDMIYFNVPDPSQPIGLNPLDRVPPLKRSLGAAGLWEVFKKIWADSWGPWLEHLLRNALLALVQQPEATLADILRLLEDRGFRKQVAARVASPHVRHFWLREYEGYPTRFRAEAIAPLQNKAGAFLTDPLLHRILTQPESTFDLREVMDEGNILLVNLAKGKIGGDTAALLGALLVARVGLAAMSRADLSEEELRDFFLYLDEFQNFTTLSLATMPAELRKYQMGMILAHQYLSQLDPEVRDAILGNVGTIICFRVGLADAEILQKEFSPEFSAIDMTRLLNYHIYLRRMVGGTSPSLSVPRPLSLRIPSAETRPRSWWPKTRSGRATLRRARTCPVS